MNNKLQLNEAVLHLNLCLIYEKHFLVYVFNFDAINNKGGRKPDFCGI